jgi:hypothetical protein
MMSDKTQILNSLQSIANEYSFVAIIWHVVILIFFALLFFRVVSSQRITGTLISLPLISVAVFAWISGNPFNGSVFALLAVLVLIFGFRIPVIPLEPSRLPFLIIGILMVIFGLVYPHFLENGSPVRYLVAAPTGLVPCPTLSLVIGLALIFSGFHSQAMMLTLVVAGLFYGIFGAFRLGVTLDLFLLFGTASLLFQYFLMLKNRYAWGNI